MRSGPERAPSRVQEAAATALANRMASAESRPSMKWKYKKAPAKASPAPVVSTGVTG